MKQVFDRLVAWSDKIAESGMATVFVILVFAIIQILANVMIYLSIMERLK